MCVSVMRVLRWFKIPQTCRMYLLGKSGGVISYVIADVLGTPYSFEAEIG